MHERIGRYKLEEGMRSRRRHDNIKHDKQNASIAGFSHARIGRKPMGDVWIQRRHKTEIHFCERFAEFKQMVDDPTW